MNNSRIEENSELYKYHKNRSILDFTYINSVFEKDDREMLKRLQDKHPNHIIRMPNSDLIAARVISGIGGSVPANWNGRSYPANTL